MLSKFHEIADEDHVVHVLKKDDKWCALIENDKRKDTLGIGSSMSEALVDLANKLEDEEYLPVHDTKTQHSKLIKNMAYVVELVSLLGIITKFIRSRRR